MSENYFASLNYTLSNEDTRVEYRLAPMNLARTFAIGGSGARVLPLIARHPKEIDIVDLSSEQLALVELRLAAARRLTRDEFLFFLGYRGGLPSDTNKDDDRMDLFRKIESELSETTRAFWSERHAAWGPRGFILLGRWEGHFQKLGRLFRNGLRIDARPIFEAHSLAEQNRLFDAHFKPLAFKLFIKAAASEFVFNRFLYKGHFSGRDGARTEARTPSDFIIGEFTRLFRETLVRKNYFLQTLFLGGIAYEEGLPLEARADVLEAVRNSETKPHYIRENLLEVLGRETYGFVSLSDTISYLDLNTATGLLGRLKPDTPTGARVVIRSFLRKPPALEATGWHKLATEETNARALDTTGVYEFDIFEKG